MDEIYFLTFYIYIYIYIYIYHLRLCVVILIHYCNTIEHFFIQCLWNEKKQSNMQSIFLLASVGAKIFFPFKHASWRKTRLLRRPHLEIRLSVKIYVFSICQVSSYSNPQQEVFLQPNLIELMSVGQERCSKSQRCLKRNNIP